MTHTHLVLIVVACITDVPWLLEALGGVDLGEGRFEEGRVVVTGEAVVVEVVAGGDDEVSAQLLPDYSHLRSNNLLVNLNEFGGETIAIFCQVKYLVNLGQ